MKSHKNTIILNGRVYDSISGKPLDGPKKTKSSTVKLEKRPASKPAAKAAPASKQTLKTQTRKINYLHPHKRQHAKTLMRRSVAKPKESIRVSGAVASTGPIAVSGEPVVFTSAIEKKFDKAKHIKKSKLITKFGPIGTQQALVSTSQALPVQPTPTQKSAASESESGQDQLSRLIAKSLKNASETPGSKHSQRKRRLPGTKSAAAAVAFVVLAGGIFALKTINSSQFKQAASRAGVASAESPAYSAAGYALKGPIEYAPGQLSLRYGSNSDERSYTITEKASSLDNNSLENTQVLGDSTDFLTLEANGTKVYVYGNHQAAWIKDGVQYQLDTGGNLNTEQILKIVSSMK